MQSLLSNHIQLFYIYDYLHVAVKTCELSLISSTSFGVLASLFYFLYDIPAKLLLIWAVANSPKLIVLAIYSMTDALLLYFSIAKFTVLYCFDGSNSGSTGSPICCHDSPVYLLIHAGKSNSILCNLPSILLR